MRYCIIILLILSSACLATNEAVYKINNNQTIYLTLLSSPKNTGSGYIRLSGILKGSENIAILEIAGKGAIVHLGEKIDEYKITSISDKGVVLCLGR